MDLTLDHPHVRSAISCPVCSRAKDQNRLCCWPCWRNGVKDQSNPRSLRAIDVAEERLAESA